MKQTICGPTGLPTANLAVNKSRIKIHKPVGSLPTYYLENNTEFQIELFNPTTDTVLAKIELNGKTIGQAGLVLRPGQRVFLERYFDVAKKFKFETYEVSNTAEVQKAIAENGDLKVQFFKESKPYYSNPILFVGNSNNGLWNSQPPYYGSGTPDWMLRGSNSAGANINASNGMNTTTLYNSSSGTLTSCTLSTANFNNLADAKKSEVTMDMLNMDLEKESPSSNSLGKRLRKTKSIETGRVEAGSSSDQKFDYVDKSFDYYAFHTVEYKMLPVSQKVNTVNDVNIKRFCTNCAAKHTPTAKFCSQCGRPL